MKKIIVVFCVLLALVGCDNTSEHKSAYSKEEQDILDAYNLLNEAENDCAYPKTVKKMLKTDFKEKNFKQYCSLNIDNPKPINKLIKLNVPNKEIEAYSKLKYFNNDKITRYVKAKQGSPKKNVIFVNMNLDKKPYEDATIITSVDEKTLVNKYNQLYENYKANNLVKVRMKYTDDKKIKLNNKTYTQFKIMEKDANEEGINLTISKGYLSYNQAEKVYNDKNSSEHFKPGYNEHQTGYAVDFSGLTKKDQEWLNKNAYKYGFIKRYPETKISETLYHEKSNHFRYVGINLAKYLHKYNMSLEYYYATR